jgi:single-strand DNA-binding protein
MLNKAQIIGNLGRDPEMRYLPSGDAVANISVATTEKWKDKASGEMKEHTEWHRISFFGKQAEIAGQYLKKGSTVYVEGKIQTREYTDKEGVKKYATEIKGEVMKMVGGKSDQGDQSAKPAQRQAPARQPQRPSSPQQAGGFEDFPDSDVPF